MFSTCRKSPKYSTTRALPLSVIVCAKNEAQNLAKLVPALFAQKYPKYQIIIVDDCSSDDTPMVLAELKTRFPALYTTAIPIDRKFSHGKKLAVVVGIKAAKYDHLVFTDADCLPASDTWLNEIACKYMDGRDMVIGYGRYAKERGLLNFYIRYETFWNAVQYFGIAKRMKPFMGVGRNLSYKKQLFEESTKFRNTYHIASGDDDLFICEKGTRKNTAISYSPDSQTVSVAKSTWSEWVAQKARHLTTSKFYPTSVKLVLGAETASRLLFYVGAALLLIFTDLLSIIISASIIFVRELLMYLSLGISSRRMGERGLWPFAIIMDIATPFIQALAWMYGAMTQSRNTWR